MAAIEVESSCCLFSQACMHSNALDEMSSS